MGLREVYDERVLPRLIDLALGRPVEGLRVAATAPLRGEVLEIGFGSGRNLPFLPDTVTRVLAVEPSPGGRALAAARIAASPVPVEFVGLDGEVLPLPDASVDEVLVTWTLCTIPDVDRALGEVRRVLRPGGRLHFVEHVRSQRPTVARRQQRLTPLWGRLAGGCRLDRPTPELVERAGLVIEQLEQPPVVGPATFATMVRGIARRD